MGDDGQGMKELELLLNRRWILKSEDKELYYQVRDAIGEIRPFAMDKLGCQVIENSLLVKLEKIPAIPQPFMGIPEFASREEYAFLCVLLMFLEDRDPEEQFILSQLTEYISGNMPGQAVDWTLFGSRRKLVKVLRYAVSQGLLRVTDGSDDLFMDQETGEVLYENTGASRYFTRNFPRDIGDYSRPEDFRESDWFAIDEDRGIARRHRVYKRLLFSPGMYREEGPEEDFEYLKYYGRRLAEDLERAFSCQVHIHRGSAFLLTGPDCHMGDRFPGNNAISDIILLCCGQIRQKAESGEWQARSDETIQVDLVTFEQMLRGTRERFGSGFTKNYREQPEGEFIREVTEAMERLTFIRRNRAEGQVTVYPLAGKMTGRYPGDYEGGTGSEQQMAGE